MGYYMFKEKGGRSEASEFRRAAKMAKEAIETMCDLADEMEDRYAERRGDYERHEGYNERGGYGRRGHDDYDGYAERRMRMR